MSGKSAENERIVASLRSLGLTKYEAQVYIALLRANSATATGIHGISGVPRASVYPVLSQLEEKGLVSISRSSPRRFTALPPDEGVKSLLARIEADARSAQETLSEVYRESLLADRSGQELIWNVHGIAAIRRKLAELIRDAEKSIRIMAHCDLFSEEIAQALVDKSRTLSVEIYTHRWVAPLPPSMKVVVRPPPELLSGFPKARNASAGGVCVIDDRRILVVIGTGSEDDIALFSESDGFVRFFSRYYAVIRDFAERRGQ